LTGAAAGGIDGAGWVAGMGGVTLVVVAVVCAAAGGEVGEGAAAGGGVGIGCAVG
jgi:hypothetical protein